MIKTTKTTKNAVSRLQMSALVSEIFKSENCVKYAPFRVGQSPAQFLCDRKEYRQLRIRTRHNVFFFTKYPAIL